MAYCIRLSVEQSVSLSVSPLQWTATAPLAFSAIVRNRLQKELLISQVAQNVICS